LPIIRFDDFVFGASVFFFLSVMASVTMFHHHIMKLKV
jgi:hypothetical protein